MKTCIVFGCNYRIFSHGFCKIHQSLRIDKKWYDKHPPDFTSYYAMRNSDPEYEIIHKITKHYSIKKITSKKLKEKQKLHKEDKLFYEEVWNERPHVCIKCLATLEDILNWSWMHHILFKGSRPYKHLRHEKRNVIILCQSCHGEAHYANPPEYFKILVKETYQYFQSINLLS